ncbi:MAG: hypothetical protein OXC38_05190 [Gammaproteobacteria bacterium]|nr:hypothetical protein [Gammaproteobacteria bacterium]
MNISLELIAIVALWLTTTGFLLSLHRDVADLRERMGRLEGRMEHLEGKMEHLEGRIERLEGRVGHLEELFQGFRRPASGYG